MADQTIKKAIQDFLENMSEIEFRKFCQALVDRKAKPRIATSRVEGKDFLDVTNVIVRTYGETKALEVVFELLRVCAIDATDLVAETKEITSKAGSSQSAGASAGTDQVTPKEEGAQFVETYRKQLVQRVKNVSQILDELLARKVIDQETYDKIRPMKPSQEQMRELFDDLNTAQAKEIFYEILVEMQTFLIEDLKKN